MPFPVADVPPAPAAAPAATASATAVVARPTGPKGSAGRLQSAERLTAETAALRHDKRDEISQQQSKTRGNKK